MTAISPSDSVADSAGGMRGSRFGRERLKSPIVLYYLGKKAPLVEWKLLKLQLVFPPMKYAKLRNIMVQEAGEQSSKTVKICESVIQSREYNS